uniref:Sialin n=1 Tax=Strigamia maritima TaxID=126957 RepID=T1IXH3_STRMM
MDTADEKTELCKSDSKNKLTPILDQHVPTTRHHWWQLIPKRYLVACMAFLGFCNVYILRANLSVAIVDMVANKSHIENGTIIYKQEFNWDTKLQGTILGAFFYGYIVTQIPGGWMATYFGGKIIFGIGVMLTALLTLLTPFAARLSVYALIAVRVLEGLTEGLAYPAIHALWTHWAPPMEKTRLATIAFSGSYIGMTLAFPISGLLAQHLGWPSIFYFFGIIAFIWWLLWIYIIRETPQQHETITRYELDFIQDSIGISLQPQDNNPPWSHVFTSLPVWAIVLAHFSENWGFYTMLTGLPTFIKDVLKMELEQLGFISGMIIQAIFMLVVALSMTRITVIICLTIAIGIGGFVWSAFGVNHLDIAPRFASLLMGLSNCIATIPGIITPILNGQIVVNKSESEWQMIFFIASGVYLGGAIFYGLFASGEPQKWAESTSYSSCTDVHSAEEIPFANE